MTDEEIQDVLTSVEALEDDLTLKDIKIIYRISVIRKNTQKTSLCTRGMTGILASIVVLKNRLTPGDIKNLYRILAAHGCPPICSSCGRKITDFKLFSWDHIFARSIGGPDSIKNLTPMHTTCNVAKGSFVDPVYFSHVDPELLKEMKPLYQDKPHKTPKPVTKSHIDKPGKTKKRHHIRLLGGAGINIESLFSR